MVRLKNVASNIFSSTTLFFVFMILFGYLVCTGILTKNRIQVDSIIRLKVHNELLREASSDYISSILWMDYSVKTRENSIISDQIVKAIHEKYDEDSQKIYTGLDDAVMNGKSDMSALIDDITSQYGDKIVLYRHGDKLYTLSDDTYDNLLFVFPTDSVRRHIRTDISRDILLNQSPTFQNFQNFVYNVEPDTRKINFNKVLVSFTEKNYDPNNLKGLMVCASYINWKRGLFGDNLTLDDGKPNPNVRQLVIVSKINISETLLGNPLIVKHISNFQKNSVAIDRTFEDYNKYNLIIMVGNLIMAIMIGLTVMIQYDLENIKKATKRRRRRSDDATVN